MKFSHLVGKLESAALNERMNDPEDPDGGWATLLVAAAAEIKNLQRRERHLTQYLRELGAVTTRAIAALDAEMKRPSTEDRGKRIAQITNGLDYARDCAWHFGLGLEWKEIARLKKAAQTAGGVQPLAELKGDRP